MNTTNATEPTAITCVCASCRITKADCAPHPMLNIACWECRDRHDTATKILKLLAGAQRFQMNQRTMAGKLGRTALTLNPALAWLSRSGLIERAYSNPNLERPSATTYKLTAGGEAAAKEIK